MANYSAWLPSSRFSAEEYLARYKLRSFLVEIVATLLQSRPTLPVDFVCDFLCTHQRSTSPLLDAYRSIRLTPTRCIFDSFLFGAFNCAVAQPGCAMRKAFSGALPSLEGEGEDVRGLANRKYFNIVRLLCADLPEPVAVRITTLLCRAGESAGRAGLDKWDLVGFGQFSSGVRTVLACESFMRQSDDLFRNALSNSCSGGFAPTAAGIVSCISTLKYRGHNGLSWGDIAHCVGEAPLSVQKDKKLDNNMDKLANIPPQKRTPTLANKVAYISLRDQMHSQVTFLAFEESALDPLLIILPGP